MARVEIDEIGTKRYLNDAGLIHREDGPAIIQADGQMHWYRSNTRFRGRGPNVEFPNGFKARMIDWIVRWPNDL